MNTAELLLSGAKQCIDTVVQQMSKKNPKFRDKFMKAAWSRVGGKERSVSTSADLFYLRNAIVLVL